MADKRIIAVAYVTKWAATRGIVVYRNVSVSEGGYLWTGWQAIPECHWSENAQTAEGRWRQAIQREAQKAEKRAAALRDMLVRTPKYMDRSHEEG
jgi:hypothetical protein